ncbi:MAG: hypothetical protein Q9165_004963 [Trypethelium subeluteriae]
MCPSEGHIREESYNHLAEKPRNTNRRQSQFHTRTNDHNSLHKEPGTMHKLSSIYERARRDLRISEERYQDALERFNAAKQALDNELQDFELDSAAVFEFLNIATDNDLLAAQNSEAKGRSGNRLKETWLAQKESQKAVEQGLRSMLRTIRSGTPGSPHDTSKGARDQETLDTEARSGAEKTPRALGISPTRPPGRLPDKSAPGPKEGAGPPAPEAHEQRVGPDRLEKRSRGRPQKSTSTVDEHITTEVSSEPNPRGAEKGGMLASKTGKRLVEDTLESEPKRQRLAAHHYQRKTWKLDNDGRLDVVTDEESG